MLYTIYKVTNKINSKIYVGKHQTKNPNDSYYGSGKFIKAAIKKYGKENFVKEVLFIFQTEHEMNSKEKELITEEFVSRKDTYNAGVGGEGGPHFKSKKHTAETKKIISERCGRSFTEDEKRLLSERQKGRPGKPHTTETKLKISKSRKGRKNTEETKQKIREARAKQIFSEETKKKMSESARNRKRK